MTSKPQIAVFWFRRDLRFSDNCGLFHALRSDLPVLPLFIFDKNILDPLPSRDARVTFIRHTLENMQNELSRQGRSLMVRYGRPSEIFKDLCQTYDIREVYTNHDYEPYAQKRDLEIETLLKKRNIDFRTFKDQVIFEKREILTRNDKPFTVYTPYRKTWQAHITPGDIAPYSSETMIKNFHKVEPQPMPTLAEMGFEPFDLYIPPIDPPEDILHRYDRQRDYPAISGTSRLGVHLRFGTVSVRRMVEKAMLFNDTWLSELVWREFFMMILANFPHVVDQPFNPKYAHIPWRDDNENFIRWCEGQTGYPIVDAGMRELNQTGFMHNRVRMITASFLTKHLLIDWRSGERYFAKKLLDYDLSANNGNWQWAAGCGCDAAPYFRIFNPYLQTERFDPDHTYIRKWVPEFEKPEYPQPIVEHKFARARALAVYGGALENYSRR